MATCVDFQHNQFTKVKSRLTALAIKLCTRPEPATEWITEPLTNGIVLSCTDDITRDFQLDKRPSKAVEAVVSPTELNNVTITVRLLPLNI